ncbi:uncharacterized protein RCC_08817 [Ramularia collo-cygni]|uniref:Uncharacterized protein n=1 Tax=Ramularia collo-cygni TaxID=112498 RepID=A0A2D3UYF4_9PEZI|nr:uncharacterized protein RCC_08817 [Ramularia collo-cygni]CZT23107.1 uncharacterized protein RCC_08817 [Ramularia collo-cygni]
MADPNKAEGSNNSSMDLAAIGCALPPPAAPPPATTTTTLALRPATTPGAFGIKSGRVEKKRSVAEIRQELLKRKGPELAKFVREKKEKAELAAFDEEISALFREEEEKKRAVAARALEAESAASALRLEEIAAEMRSRGR